MRTDLSQPENVLYETRLDNCKWENGPYRLESAGDYTQCSNILKIRVDSVAKHQAYLKMSNLDSGNCNIIQFETGEHPSQLLGWDSNSLRFSFPCHKLMASDREREREFLYLIYIV